MYEQSEDALVGAGAGQPHRDGPGIAGHHRADAKEAKAQRVALGARKFRPLKSGAAHRLEQGVGKRREQHPVLIRPPLRARGPVGEQAKLLLLQPILHVPTLTVQLLVQPPCFAVQIGHDETRISPLGTVLDSRDDPSAPAPSARSVVELAEHPALHARRLESILGGDIYKQANPLKKQINPRFGQRIKAGVGAENQVDAQGKPVREDVYNEIIRCYTQFRGFDLPTERATDN